jgi:hypothetical protein
VRYPERIGANARHHAELQLLADSGFAVEEPQLVGQVAFD